MAHAAQGSGWWQASDGRWYPPEARPGGSHYYTVDVPGASGPGAGSLVLNVIWLVLAGFWLAVLYASAGVVLCITIIGIPFGLQCFKLAVFTLWPFGRFALPGPRSGGAWNFLGNLIWFLLIGVWMAIAHLATGVLLCLTIIGIPLGLGNFKLIPLILFPFGKVIVVSGR